MRGTLGEGMETEGMLRAHCLALIVHLPSQQLLLSDGPVIAAFQISCYYSHSHTIPFQHSRHMWWDKNKLLRPPFNSQLTPPHSEWDLACHAMGALWTKAMGRFFFLNLWVQVWKVSRHCKSRTDWALLFLFQTQQPQSGNTYPSAGNVLLHLHNYSAYNSIIRDSFGFSSGL